MSGETAPGNSTASADPGLCGSCRHSRTITSDRGSAFYLCQLSFTDPNFPKYPRLPVLACAGYSATGPPA